MSIITDEMVEDGLVASCRDYANGVCDKPCFQCNRDVRAVLTAVAPMIRAAALEEAAKVADVLEGDTEYVYYGRPTIGGSIRALAKERGDE